MGRKNLFADIPESMSGEFFEELLQTSTCRMERIVSRGHCSPEGFWYDQNLSEWLLILQGKAVLALEDVAEPITLNPGDYLNIPAHTRHRVLSTDMDRDTIWLAVYY
jgi:cupin 2 domain-containing protein